MYPLMFLGGLYFPVLHLAYPLKLLVVANPVTYLVNGLRDSLECIRDNSFLAQCACSSLLYSCCANDRSTLV